MGVNPDITPSLGPGKVLRFCEQPGGQSLALVVFFHTYAVEGSVWPIIEPCAVYVPVTGLRPLDHGYHSDGLPFLIQHMDGFPADGRKKPRTVRVPLLPLADAPGPERNLGLLHHGKKPGQVILVC